MYKKSKTYIKYYLSNFSYTLPYVILIFLIKNLIVNIGLHVAAAGSRSYIMFFKTMRDPLKTVTKRLD